MVCGNTEMGGGRRYVGVGEGGGEVTLATPLHWGNSLLTYQHTVCLIFGSIFLSWYTPNMKFGLEVLIIFSLATKMQQLFHLEQKNFFKQLKQLSPK